MSDPLAASAARSMIFDLLCPRPYARGADPALTGPDSIADRIAGEFDARWWRGGGLRRLVLTGPAEVDPEAAR
jgi:hypothetical protein